MEDHSIAWMRKRRVFTPFEMRALITKAVNEAGGTSHAEGDLLTSPLDVTTDQFEVSTLGYVGNVFSAAGKIFVGCLDLPFDVDPKFPMGFRVHWTNSAAAAAGRGVTYKVLADIIKKGVAYAAATTVLDTLIAESLITAAWANEISPRGIKNSLGIKRSDVEDGCKLVVSIEADVIDASVANVTFMGLEIDYVPQMTVGQGSHINRPLQSNGVQ